MRVFVEGYGCSLNKADTEQIRGFLSANSAELTAFPAKADCMIINTCAVKQQTEAKMLRRIRQLNAIAVQQGSKLVVAGCLPLIHQAAVKEISPAIIQVGPRLSELSACLNLPDVEFSPLLPQIRENTLVSIIPVARGCLGSCSYCCVKNARGNLRSYSVNELHKKFKKAIGETPEVWLTAQDCGCYGKDIGTSLHLLLKELLANSGRFRIRVGMINPGHLKEFPPAYLHLFDDERLYRFFHVPVQSGSNDVLRAMNRNYRKEDFLRIVEKIRMRFADAVIATDVIVGFPGETEQQFKETIAVLKKAEPDVVNISRFGARPGTAAADMPRQLHGRELKRKSRQLSRLCCEISLQRNKRLVGKEACILVTEKGKKGNFVGRAANYKPVVIRQNALGKFIRVKIRKAFPTYVYAVPEGE